MLVEIYTDGCCLTNPGKGGWCAIFKALNKRKALYGFHQSTTNNRMEITAVVRALNHLSRPCDVMVYTDSEYVLKGATIWMRNWKRNNWTKCAWDPSSKTFIPGTEHDIVNKDLWQMLDKAQSRHHIQYQKVLAHAGIQSNVECDLIAKQAALLQIEGLRELVYAPTLPITEKQIAQIPCEIERSITFE